MTKHKLMLGGSLMAIAMLGCSLMPGGNSPTVDKSRTATAEASSTVTSLPAPTYPVTKTPKKTATIKSTIAVPGPTSTPRLRQGAHRLYCQTADEQAMGYYNEALSATQAGNISRAQELYLQAIEADPKFCDAMDNLGLLYRGQWDLEQAIYWYKRSIEVYPQGQAAHQNLAVAYNLQGNNSAAIAEYEWLVENYPDEAEGYYGLGTIYMEDKQYRQAISWYEQAAEIYEKQGDATFLADAHASMGFAYFFWKITGRPGIISNWHTRVWEMTAGSTIIWGCATWRPSWRI